MELNLELKRSEDYVFNEVDGELVMMNIETGSYASMNETGKSIWEALEGTQTVETVLNGLTKEYDITFEQAQKEVTPFLIQLQEKGIIITA